MFALPDFFLLSFSVTETIQVAVEDFARVSV